jgi:hypothetical protein
VIRLRAPLVLILLLFAAQAKAQPVPEGIHSIREGQPNLCGETAPTIADLQSRLAARLPGLPGNERFVAYEDEPNMRVWTFTTSAHAAHPAVACRTVTDVNGHTNLDLKIDCRSTRENCDALYREFEALNARMLRELERAADNERPAS